MERALYRRHRNSDKKHARGTSHGHNVLTTQVVFVENSAKSPTACRKQNCAIRNKWKFRNGSDMRCTTRGTVAEAPYSIIKQWEKIDLAAFPAWRTEGDLNSLEPSR